MKELRCKKCNKLFFKYSDLKGGLEIRCPRCGEDHSNFMKEEKIEFDSNGKIKAPKIISYIKL